MKQIQEIKDYLTDLNSAIAEIYELVLQLEQDLQKQAPEAPVTGIKARLKNRQQQVQSTQKPQAEEQFDPKSLMRPPPAPPVQILEGLDLGGGMELGGGGDADNGRTNSNKGSREYIPPGFVFQKSPLEKLVELEMQKVEAQMRLKGK